MSDTSAGPGSDRRLSGLTWIALVAILLIYPALYSSGIMAGIVRPIIVEQSRTHWWAFWWANMLFHWVPFGLVWLALWSSGEDWRSIGVDWAWFWQMRWVIGAVILLLSIAAFVVPELHYNGDPPGISQTIFLGPVTPIERLWIIWVAVTAGVTEEVLFRGFAIARLTRVLGNPWLALPITVVAFVFIHGSPRGVGPFVAYVMAGLGFGVPFVLMKLKRLEVLIAIHFFIDASMVFAP
jgi:membrane protease YdiL (CAAX protease family)